MTSTEERIKKIMMDTLGLDESKLTFNANFKTDLYIDSLDLVEVIVAMEKEFDITIPEEQIEVMQSMGQIADYVNKTTHPLAV